MLQVFHDLDLERALGLIILLPGALFGYSLVAPRVLAWFFFDLDKKTRPGIELFIIFPCAPRVMLQNIVTLNPRSGSSAVPCLCFYQIHPKPDHMFSEDSATL